MEQLQAHPTNPTASRTSILLHFKTSFRFPYYCIETQGWLRVIGLIRRACGRAEESDRGNSGGPNGAAPGGVESSGVPPPPPPPRVAFELALEVCVLCERPDAGLEVLSLMRSTGLQADLEDYKVSVRKAGLARRDDTCVFSFLLHRSLLSRGCSGADVSRRAQAHVFDREGLVCCGLRWEALGDNRRSKPYIVCPPLSHPRLPNL